MKISGEMNQALETLADKPTAQAQGDLEPENRPGRRGVPPTAGPVDDNRPQRAGSEPKGAGPPSAPADGVDASDVQKLQQLLDNPIFGAGPHPGPIPRG